MGAPPNGMRAVPGGRSTVGSDFFYEEEAPARSEEVATFRMDATPVTNAQFARFVAATGYRTWAEVAPDPGDYPDADPALLVAGSAVFAPTPGPVDLAGAPVWWRFVAGADWRHPLGPDSGLDGLEHHPVVHVAYADALAYAQWAGKSLPTEVQWEHAARGGAADATYAWGDAFAPQGRRMANTWQGDFPWRNTSPASEQRTSKVRRYPPNAFGLYDMIGNVWEWTTTRPEDDPRHVAGCCGLAGGATERRMLKGGSHLCAPEYCQRYRPAARLAQPIDTTTSHSGFRCVVN